MNERPQSVTLINDFQGQQSNVDPGDCNDGAMVQQVNMMTVVRGQLTTRGGLKRVTLEELE